MALTPPVWRHRSPQPLALAAFAAAAVAGGITTATGLWLLSGLSEPLPGGVRIGLVAALAAALALRAVGRLSFGLPQAARQIPRSVFDLHPVAAATRFGFALGTGVRTYVPSSLPHLVAAGILLLRPPLIGAVALGTGFGLARGLVPAASRVTART